MRNKKRQPTPSAQPQPAQKIENKKYYKVFHSQEEDEKRKLSEAQAPSAKRRVDEKLEENQPHPGGEDQRHHVETKATKQETVLTLAPGRRRIQCPKKMGNRGTRFLRKVLNVRKVGMKSSMFY